MGIHKEIVFEINFSFSFQSNAFFLFFMFEFLKYFSNVIYFISSFAGTVRHVLVLGVYENVWYSNMAIVMWCKEMWPKEDEDTCR